MIQKKQYLFVPFGHYLNWQIIEEKISKNYRQVKNGSNDAALRPTLMPVASCRQVIIQEMMAMGRLYWWYKAHNICTQCRKEETVPGRTLCPECAEKSRIRAAERRAAKRDEINREQKEWNRRMKEKGLCRCGRPARPGKVQCLECALRDNRRTLARRHSSGRTLPHGLRQELHICRRCSKPAVPGYYFCEEHLAKQREYMAKAIAAGMNDSNVIAARKWMRRTMM